MVNTPSSDGGAGHRVLLHGAMGIARNLLLTARTVVEHLTDDPVVLALQVARRAPASASRTIAMLGTRIFHRDASVPGAVCRAVLGDHEGLRLALTAASGDPLAPAQSVRLADVATAVGETDLARRLLSAVRAGDERAAGARARLAWHGGDMSGAVLALEGLNGRGGRVRERLAAELRTFKGRRPTIRKRDDYDPIPRRALHMVTNSLPHTGSGYAQRTQSVLAALRDQGWDVMAVTRLGYPVQVGKPLAPGRDTVDGVTYVRMLPARLPDGLDQRLQQQADTLALLVESYRPSVLHTTTHFVNAVVVRAVAEAFGIPWIYEVRGQLADTWASTRDASARDSERYRLFREREAEAARSADGVVTLGEAMLREILDQGVPTERIVLCPNAVGEEFLRPPRDRGDARTELGLDPSKRHIGTVSSIVAYEGLDDLVAAFADLAPELPDLTLLIAGDGVALPALRVQAARAGVADRVVFAGRVPRSAASNYHQALDVFVVPRKDLDVTRSVTPLKPVEALASERPVVASDLPALAELVHDGVTGLLVPAGDPSQLVSALRRLLEDRELADAFGRSGREWVLADRTWEANAKRYTELYGKVLGDTRGSLSTDC